MRLLSLSPLLPLLPLLVHAQWVTQTQIDDDTGYTVVDRVSYGAGGQAVQTRIISTILDGLQNDAATTAPPRIVGQPGTNTGVATIVYVFTSSDGNVYTATFTPHYQSPTPTSAPGSGTVISAADWTYTEAASVDSGAVRARAWEVLGAWARVGAVLAVGAGLGGWWVL